MGGCYGWLLWVDADWPIHGAHAGVGHVIDAVLPQLNPDGSFTIAATTPAPNTTAASDTDGSSNDSGDFNPFEGRSTEVIVLGGFGVLLLLAVIISVVVLIRRRPAKRPPVIVLPPPAQYYDNRTLAPDGGQLMQYTSGGDASPLTAGAAGPTDTIMVRSTLGGDYVEILQEKAESGLARRGTVTLGGDPFLRAGEIPFDATPADVRPDTATPDPPEPEPDSPPEAPETPITRQISLMTSQFNRVLPAPAPPPPPTPQHLPSTPASSNPSRAGTSGRRPPEPVTDFPTTPLQSMHPPPPRPQQRHFYPGQSPVVEHGPAATRAQSKKGRSRDSGLAAPVHPSLLLLKGRRSPYLDTIPYNPMDPAAAHEFNRTGTADSLYFNARSSTPANVPEGAHGHGASVMYTSVDHNPAGNIIHNNQDPDYNPALNGKVSQAFAPDHRRGELQRSKRFALQNAASRWRQSRTDPKQGRR